VITRENSAFCCKEESKPSWPEPFSSRRLHGVANDDWVTEWVILSAGNMNVTVVFSAATMLLGEKANAPLGNTWIICCPAIDGDGRAAEEVVEVVAGVLPLPGAGPYICGTARTKEEESKRKLVAKRIVNVENG